MVMVHVRPSVQQQSKSEQGSLNPCACLPAPGMMYYMVWALTTDQVVVYVYQYMYTHYTYMLVQVMASLS